MTRFARLLLRRVALLIALLAAVFAAVDLLPGSTARAVLGRDATEAAVAAKERELGLDRPLPVRFGDWLAGVLTGDFGTTARGRSVGELLADTFPQTLLLGGLAFAVTIAASLAFGGWWSIRPRGVLGRVLQPSTTTAVAVPEFVVATLLIRGRRLPGRHRFLPATAHHPRRHQLGRHGPRQHLRAPAQPLGRAGPQPGHRHRRGEREPRRIGVRPGSGAEQGHDAHLRPWGHRTG
ncbi:ABC transporter permease [Nocardia cyriacigeorgica]|uniref:ABC transporter permease n=1 Tax=Nocardia cyriacigeorgica TaxID=135487 RepID=UPI0024B567B7|nr:ABC transporter permease [Nocardia cyriacigeorgica]